jgi:hypothetical protein
LNYKYIISREEYVGMIVTEYMDEKPNCVWELEFVKNRINIGQEIRTSHSKQSIKRCINWLIANHSELLL